MSSSRPLCLSPCTCLPSPLPRPLCGGTAPLLPRLLRRGNDHDREGVPRETGVAGRTAEGRCSAEPTYVSRFLRTEIVIPTSSGQFVLLTAKYETVAIYTLMYSGKVSLLKPLAKVLHAKLAI